LNKKGLRLVYYPQQGLTLKTGTVRSSAGFSFSGAVIFFTISHRSFI
jgi:hypothetical protein